MSVDRHLHQMCFVHMISYTEMATKGNQGSSRICVCCVVLCCVALRCVALRCVVLCCVVWCCARVVCVSTYILIPACYSAILLLYHTTLHSRASTNIL